MKAKVYKNFIIIGIIGLILYNISLIIVPQYAKYIGYILLSGWILNIIPTIFAKIKQFMYKPRSNKRIEEIVQILVIFFTFTHLFLFIGFYTSLILFEDELTNILANAEMIYSLLTLIFIIIFIICICRIDENNKSTRKTHKNSNNLLQSKSV